MSTLVSIGHFSRITLLSVKTLRHYHDVGLLLPAEIDPETSYRRYAIEQVSIAQAIRRLRELGMPVDEVKRVVEAPNVAARNAAIGAHLRHMEGVLERTRSTVASLRLLLDEASPPVLPISYAAIGPSEALAIRDELASDDVPDWLAGAIDELRRLEARGAGRRSGPDAALYSVRLLEEERGDIVAILPVESRAPGLGRAEPLELPRQEYAIAVHVGSTADIDRTYAALGSVVAQRALGVEGPIRENYLVGPLETPDESAHRTEICWPIFQTIPGA